VNAAMTAMPHSSASRMRRRVLIAARAYRATADRPAYDGPMPEPPIDDRLVVIGQGYVGLPLAMRAVERGFSVVGLDRDHTKVKRLAAGESAIEDVPDDRLAAALATGRYRPTADPGGCAGFDVAVISVPTPLTEGVPDLRHIEDAAATLAPHLRPGATVVLESTTYPGTTEELVGPRLEEGSGLVAGEGFHLGYSPERIDPGNAVWRFENTPKVVSGVDRASLDAVDGFYRRLVDATVPVSSPKEAELTKLLENTFRHVNIALVNELAVFAHELGIDVWEAIDAASTKPFGYLRFTPGPGVGGHCLPIDPSYLSWRVRQSLGHAFRFVELANDVNDHMPDYVVTRVTEALNQRELPVKGRTILLVGLAYKRNTSDARETPARPIARRLCELGATVLGVDPHIDDAHVPDGVTRVALDAGVTETADAVVVLVDHDAVDLGLLARHARYVLDTRRVLPPSPRVEYL
jgi:UDP-N-acetyl-D-glucosamine dehydrogenase